MRALHDRDLPAAHVLSIAAHHSLQVRAVLRVPMPIVKPPKLAE